MNIKGMMSNMGTNVTRDLDPKEFITFIVSCPIITQQFPFLNTMASTVQSLLTGYEALNKQLETLRTNIQKAEKSIDTTQTVINKGQEALTGVLTKTPGLALRAVPLEGDIVPTGGLEIYQNAIIAANKSLEEAKRNLEILNEQLLALEEKIKKYYTKMVDQVKEYISSIANTKVI